MRHQKINIICKNIFENGKTTTTGERFTAQYVRLLRLLAQNRSYQRKDSSR